MKETIMNQEKLAKLQAQVRIGGKVSWVFFFFLVLLFSFPLHISRAVLSLWLIGEVRKTSESKGEETHKETGRLSIGGGVIE